MISALLRILGVVVEWFFLRWKRQTAEAESEINEIEDVQSAVTAGDEPAVQAQFSRWRRENQMADADRHSDDPDSDRLPDAKA